MKILKAILLTLLVQTSCHAGWLSSEEQKKVQQLSFRQRVTNALFSKNAYVVLSTGANLCLAAVVVALSQRIPELEAKLKEQQERPPVHPRSRSQSVVAEIAGLRAEVILAQETTEDAEARTKSALAQSKKALAQSHRAAGQTKDATQREADAKLAAEEAKKRADARVVKAHVGAHKFVKAQQQDRTEQLRKQAGSPESRRVISMQVDRAPTMLGAGPVEANDGGDGGKES